MSIFSIRLIIRELNLSIQRSSRTPFLGWMGSTVKRTGKPVLGVKLEDPHVRYRRESAVSSGPPLYTKYPGGRY